MRIHHLNCGSMRPIGARLVNGSGGLLAPGRMVCHCLLIESEAGLVLVDTGLGMGDITQPVQRLGRLFLGAVRPKLDAAETAIRQVERLGFKATDVRHIVMTHMDLDHAGGLGDFPHARVHVLRAEYRAAMERKTAAERRRYEPEQWAHGPLWNVHQLDGERWLGFDGVRTIDDKAGPEILLIPLFGHTRGHAGVAVKTGDGWLLHCGDAYFFHAEMNPGQPRCTPALRLFQGIVAMDNELRLHNQERLRELRAEGGSGIRLFSAHDAIELSRMQRMPSAVSETSPAHA